ncbi:DUF4352 domain-containing protein [Rathayibacter sp. KR2-224]|uniref:DUF4352 domain-containing protein n=1 Tax=Rathayibacter sp. KR2-224 TaxID=3400913 RepID=UPI003C0506D0
MFTRTARTTLLLCAATVVLSATLTGCSAGTTPASSSSGKPATKASTPSAPGMNTPVKAGAFEFTVLDVKDAGTTAGSAPLTKTAQGSFFQVDLKVANVGSSSQMFIADDLKLKDASGKTFSADDAATLYASGDANTWLAAINPGNAVQGPVLFDLPPGAKPTTLLVSDNAFTPGSPITIG